jgi:hypothetical protein
MRIRLQCNEPSAGSHLLQRAYTFAEVMVATGILGFVAATICSAFSAGFLLIQFTRENLRATQIMVQKMEAIRLLTWRQVSDTNYLKPSFTEAYDPLGATTNCGGAKYTGYVTATTPAAGELPDAYRTNMCTVTVTLYWTNYNGAKAIVHQREMQTRVARNGMQNYIWGN